MPLQIVKQNIFDSACDVLVNPTDGRYSGLGGLDKQFHDNAGAELRQACALLPGLCPGEARHTKSFGIGCKYVIHTHGPVWEGGKKDETVILRSCYLNSLLLATQLGAESVALPLISSGTFGFPKDLVMKIAVDAISDFLYANLDLSVNLCVFDKDSFKLKGHDSLDKFLTASENHFDVLKILCCNDFAMAPHAISTIASHVPKAQTKILNNEVKFNNEVAPEASLEAWLKKCDDTFAVTLLKMIDKKGMNQVECYKKANVSRKTFSKIMNEKDYKPSKPTVLAFAISLELTLAETEQLLKTVGFSLSRSAVFDLIIAYYITNGNYDINEINEALYKYDQVCLGC